MKESDAFLGDSCYELGAVNCRRDGKSVTGDNSYVPIGGDIQGSLEVFCSGVQARENLHIEKHIVYACREIIAVGLPV